MRRIRTTLSLLKEVQNIRAMTLPELIVGAGLLVLVATGIILAYLRAVELQEVAESTSKATKSAIARLELIRSTPFDQINATYDEKVFPIGGLLNAEGVTYVDVDDDNLYDVTASVSWKQKSGRVYGGDKDLDGRVDAGDIVVGRKLQGAVQIETKIFK